MKHLLLLLPAAVLLAACQTPPVIPPALQPEAGLHRTATLHARGVQIYECRAGEGGHAWRFVGPEADLLGPHGQWQGRHYAGPHWEAPDGSKVQATLKARTDAPAHAAIPWLLLAARSVGGAGAFSQVRAIQWVNTAGGAEPRDACAASNDGQVVRVPYTADYHFYAARP